MEPYTLTMTEDPRTDDIDFLQDRLYEYNASRTGRDDGRGLFIAFRDDAGRMVAGLHGWTWAGWLKITDLWVREDLRGRSYGTRLLQAAEAEALARGCRRATLDTYSFQAPHFYPKLGYRVVATLEDFPGGHASHWLVKDLRPPD